MIELENLRYPIGKFIPQDSYIHEELQQLISQIKTLPDRLASAIASFSVQQYATPYRDGGWTVQQLIHHMADSHMNAYIRFKWALTEDTPLIKAYDEKRWAETNEVAADAQLSIALLTALHAKWVVLLQTLSATDLAKSFIHPETKIEIRLNRLTALYAWHGNHHLAHITSLKERMKW
jgi:uncharacterized damage-inducible protein DinB